MHHSERRARELLGRLDIVSPYGAEIGVWKGEMSRNLLMLNPLLRLLMVDNWKSARERSKAYRISGDYIARVNVQRMGLAKRQAHESTEFAAGRRTILYTDSLDAAGLVPKASLDFVFIDAEHTYEAATADIQAWLPAIKPGGLLSGHDYSPPGELSPKGWPGVVRAVDEFVERGGLTLDRGEQATWFIRLP